MQTQPNWGEAATWRFDVQTPGVAGWRPYDKHGFPEADCCYAGQHSLPEFYDDPVDLAHQELDEALVPIVADVDRRGRWLLGVRISVWRQYEQTEGEPAIVLPASAEQLALARLQTGVDEVEVALRQLEEARRRLRQRAAAASSVDHLGRNQIARALKGAWSRRLVLSYLAGYGLVTMARVGLPHNWSPAAPWPESEDPTLEDGDHDLYWCGRLLMKLHPDGTVTARVFAEPEPSWGQDEDDAVDDKIDTIAWETAEVVTPALARVGLGLRGDDGDLAGAAQLAMTASGRTELALTRLQPGEAA